MIFFFKFKIELLYAPREKDKGDLDLFLIINFNSLKISENLFDIIYGSAGKIINLNNLIRCY